VVALIFLLLHFGLAYIHSRQANPEAIATGWIYLLLGCLRLME
jgi:hypothetical protein